MTTDAQPDAKPKRRRFQFSLRTLFVCVAVVESSANSGGLAKVTLLSLITLVGLACSRRPEQCPPVSPVNPAARALALENEKSEAPDVGAHDSPMFGRTPARNNVSDADRLPTHWQPGEFDSTGRHRAETAENIKWVVPLHARTNAAPAVANGFVLINSNEEGVGKGSDLFCLRAADGELQWRHSANLADSPQFQFGVPGSTPLADGDRLWNVTIRGELLCLDLRGFRDGENDGPYQDEDALAEHDADIVWRLDMVEQLGVRPHHCANCSPTAAGNLLFICTSNGVDEAHNADLPAPNAPSFLCLDKRTGEVLWTDASPGLNILHGQWSSPGYGVLGGVPQVIFGGGDGWLYSFRGERTANGKAELLWKCDCNPKKSRSEAIGRATRNPIIAAPVVYDGRVYVAVGEDIEHGEGPGLLWCVDATKRGDVSEELVFNAANPDRPIAPKRLLACVPKDGDFTKPNPNSAVIWKYTAEDVNRDGKINAKDFRGMMHRSVSTVAIHDDLLITCDSSGLVHCFDARTGDRHWSHDLLASCVSSPLIADGKVYVCDEDGDVTIFRLSSNLEFLTANENGINMGDNIRTTPVEADGVLFIATQRYLWAIAEP